MLNVLGEIPALSYTNILFPASLFILVQNKFRILAMASHCLHKMFCTFPILTNWPSLILSIMFKAFS